MRKQKRMRVNSETWQKETGTDFALQRVWQTCTNRRGKAMFSSVLRGAVRRVVAIDGRQLLSSSNRGKTNTL